ncbi:hypothetical protein Tco_0343119 [Tanacetum coccineum]
MAVSEREEEEGCKEQQSAYYGRRFKDLKIEEGINGTRRLEETKINILGGNMLEKSNPLIFVKGAGKTQVYYKGSNHLLCSFLFLYDDVVHDACLIKIDPGNPPPSEPVNSQQKHGLI